MPIPDFQNLNSLQFIDPSMYQQGRAMVDQAQQASDLQNQQATQNVQASSLANLYNEQNNPLLLAHQGLMNTQKTMDNQDKQISLGIRQDNQKEEAEATKQKWLAQASEDDLKQLSAKGEALSVRGAAQSDPDMQAKGQRMIAASAKALAARAQQGAEQTKAETQANAKITSTQVTADSREAVAAAVNASRLEQQRLRNQGVMDKVKASSDPKTAEQAATHYQLISDTSNDPAEKQWNADRAKEYANYSLALKNAQAGNKPDLSKYVKTNELNIGVGTPGAARPGGAPTSQPVPNTPGRSGQDVGQMLKLEPGVATDAQQLLLNEYRSASPQDKPYAARALKQAGYMGNPDLPASTEATPPQASKPKTIVQTGTAPNGKKVVKYSDGTIDYAP